MTHETAGMQMFDRNLLEARTYWLDRLGGDLVPTALPFDRPGRNGGRKITRIQLPDEAAANILKISGRGDFLIAALFLAGMAATFHRRLGVERAILATPLRGDSNPGGVVIDLPIPQGRTFKELLVETRKTMLAAYEHQCYPLEKLAADLGMPSLAATMLTLPAIHGPAPAGLPLSLTIEHAGDRFLLAADYDSECYIDSTVREFLEQGISLLTAGLAAPDTPVNRLPLLSGQAGKALVARLNGPVTEDPARPALHQWVSRHAAAAPTSPAIACGGEHVDYARLDAMASAVAARIRAAGVKQGDVVAVCVDRTPSMAAAVIGVMRAGAVYLPLDPAYPADRIACMIEDATPAAILAGGSGLAKLPAGRQIIPIDEAVRDGSEPFAPFAPEPADPAYLIFTSGSTGRPKGAINTHAGLSNLAAEHRRLFNVTPASRVLQFSVLSFDALISELAMTFAAGACLVLAPTMEDRMGEGLVRLLKAERVTHVTLPPSLLAVMPPDQFPDLEVVVSAGEATSLPVADAWSAGRRFINAYGVAECAVCSHIFDYEGPAKGLPIGRAMANITSYIIDDGFNPVPPGVVGELAIGGVGVGSGYLGHPEMTAKKFFDDPFRAGGRLFRTGDRARWRDDGVVEVLGRIDHQISLRGYRIEPGDIETALTAEPGVAEALVTLHESGQDKRLIAYVVGNGGPIDPERLRRRVGERLPDYMTPSAIVALPKWPLTPNGKIDRKALPLPAVGDRKRDLVAPRDRVEIGLVEIWERLLELPAIGVTDNFFDRGGHSLLAVRLMAQTKERFGLNLPLSALFENPTIAQLAPLIRSGGTTGPSRALVRLRKGRGEPLFFIHPGGGTVHCYHELAHRLPAAGSIYALQAFGIEKGESTLPTVEAMAEAYLDEIRAAEPDGPYHLAGWSFGGYVAHEIARRLAAAGARLGMVGLLDTYEPSVLSKELSLLDEAELIVGLFGDEVRLSAEHLRGMGEEERLSYVVERAKDAGMIPPDFGIDEGKRLLTVFTTNTRAVFAYRPEPFAGRLTVFRASEKIPGAQEFTRDPALGWERICRSVEAVPAPGTHENMVRPPHAAQLADLIAGIMRGAS
ncbi:MAG TPA: amino acid adenylation domain-containing protein [Candidatus Ozemobacteraceae bacterium]|nr:amino acid adenylation domain-containing protein [Candidatus Ozemobacteraceae bacterium]